ncbi:helix-turn-helix transcriptional regulator [Streptomyces spectabilis]
MDVLTAGAVQQARRQGESWAAISRALHISPDHAQKLYARSLTDRKIQRAAALRGTPQTTVTQQQSTQPSSAQPGGSRQRQELAGLLSRQQRASGLTLRRLGRLTGVTPSYLSRVLCGDKFPSWQLVERFVSACGGDPDEVQELWREGKLRR